MFFTLWQATGNYQVKDVIDTDFAIPAKYGRTAKAKIYEFKKKRHGKYYEQKRVEVVYTIAKNAVITITVYVFYGKWKGEK